MSERRFPHIPIIAHKRTASADTKQWNQITSGNKKEGLSLFSGLKSKNDPITRSNLCINGNHVYMEDSEPKSDSSKDSSLTNSPQISRKSPLYASAENLDFKPSKETVNPPSGNEKGMTSSTSNSSLKSSEQPATQTPQAEEPRAKTPPLISDVPKEEKKENKKQENKKSSLLSLVTGRKETPKPAENEQPAVPVKREAPKAPAEETGKKSSMNPFQEDLVEKKPELLPSAKTSAVKPRTNPVKPLNATQSKPISNFPQPIKSHENALNSINSKKYDPSDPASAFAQLTHDELIQVVLKQKETITKKENQVRELEDYIDNLLVRIMEETPNILRSGTQLSKKAGKA